MGRRLMLEETQTQPSLLVCCVCDTVIKNFLVVSNVVIQIWEMNDPSLTPKAEDLSKQAMYIHVPQYLVFFLNHNVNFLLSNYN